MRDSAVGVRGIGIIAVRGGAIIIACLATACGTISPSHVRDTAPSYDATTPSQYPNDSSGLLYLTTDANGETAGAIITSNARDRYNALIARYRVQYLNKHQVALHTDDGISKAKDGFGNSLWLIDAEHLEHFLLLNGWSKDDYPPDSVWDKIKHSVPE